MNKAAHRGRPRILKGSRLVAGSVWLSLAAEDHDEREWITDFSLRVSDALQGEPTTDAGQLGSFVHAKMCANAVSTEHLFTSPLADHSAIIALCRMIMEAMTLYFYLTKQVRDDEWECRRLTLRLHDTVNRIKLMRGFQSRNEYGDLINGRAELKGKLRENSFFKSLKVEQQDRLLTGEHFYVGGVQRAAQDAGWNFRKYIAHYSYFSSHAHSAPMSFLRFIKHRVSFGEPSDAQRAAVISALCVAEFCLLKTSLAHLNSSPIADSKFDRKEVAEFTKAVEDYAKHFCDCT
jgi:hypothetical protein